MVARMLSTLLALHLLAASQAPEPLIPNTTPDSPWYGWQTLIVDGSAALLVATGTYFRLTTTTGAPGNGFLGVGIGLYMVGAPTVHGVHGNGWGVLGSIGIRVLGAVGGVGVGGIASLFTRGAEPWVAPVIGTAAGAAFASFFDAQRFAWQPTPATATSTTSLGWAPFAGTVRGAPMAGVAGAF